MTGTAKRYLVYADGACLGNPGPGGWGVVIVEPAAERSERSHGPYPRTTNNRMEITAAIEGLRALKPGVHVILRSDSEYVVKTMTLGWKRNANAELWRELDHEVAKRKVRFEWVPGHTGDEWNERADKLARAAASGRALGSALAQAPLQTDEEQAARELEPMLNDDESVRRCTGCGRLFVSASPAETHCSLLQCQLGARRRP